MLRIHRNDVDAHRVVLALEGNVLLEWAELLESECEALRRSGFSVALDFSRVVFIGRSGLDVLTRLSEAGVEIFGCRPLIADVLKHQGIVAKHKFGGDR
jgi:anti-anti-sigma regulatory factor